MVHTIYVDNRSRGFNAKSIAGRRTSLQLVGYNGRDVKCNNYLRVGHVTQDCGVLKETEDRRGTLQ